MKTLFKQLLRSVIDYNEEVVNDFLKQSMKNKARIIDILRKHPNWNEDFHFIVIDGNFGRGFYDTALNNFTHFICEGLITSPEYSKEEFEKAEKVMGCIRHFSHQFFSEDEKELVDQLNDINPDYHLRYNMKLSKAINKICIEEKWDQINNYQKEYTKLSDNINPTSMNVRHIISVNPVDFLTMSNGDSWRSCHNYKDGEYKTGCLSYLMDSHSFLYYQVPINTPLNQISATPKICRQIFAFDGESDLLFQSRLYPQSNDYGAEEAYDKIRKLMAKVLSTCLGLEDSKWAISFTGIQHYIGSNESDPGFEIETLCYPDWHFNNPGGKMCTLMRPVSSTKKLRNMYLGREPYCLSCGEDLIESDSFLCENCR